MGVIVYTIIIYSICFKILKEIKKEVFVQFKFNPEDFIKQISSLISNEKATTLINSINYSKINDCYSNDVFTVNNIKGSLSKNILEVNENRPLSLFV